MSRDGIILLRLFSDGRGLSGMAGDGRGLSGMTGDGILLLQLFSETPTDFMRGN